MTVLVSLALLLTGAAAHRPALDARFIGNMAFAISDGNVTLMTDFPYQSGYSRYNTYAPSEIKSATPITLALITHRHRDHWDPSLFAGTNWKAAGPADVVSALPADRLQPLRFPRTTFNGIEIEPMQSPHPGVGHYSYVVTWHGRRLYFSGDTESTDTLAAARNLDVAFLSPWLYRSALERNVRIDARRVVIYHHEAGEQVPQCRDNCSVPKQGETFRIE
jgi:L-ascorbate metabolism protein UlaG (beta-lactamase superfamily)